jgi:hypothetical protein
MRSTIAAQSLLPDISIFFRRLWAPLMCPVATIEIASVCDMDIVTSDSFYGAVSAGMILATYEDPAACSGATPSNISSSNWEFEGSGAAAFPGHRARAGGVRLGWLNSLTAAAYSRPQIRIPPCLQLRQAHDTALIDPHEPR